MSIFEAQNNKTFMKILKSVLLISLFLLAFNSCKKVVDKSTNTIKPTQVTEVKATAFAKDVNVASFKKLVDNNTGLIVDVRTPQEYASGHIAGAINIDWKNQEEFTSKIKEVSKDKTVLIYCHSGHRSGLATKYLKNEGYSKIYNLETGIMGWKGENLPVEK